MKAKSESPAKRSRTESSASKTTTEKKAVNEVVKKASGPTEVAIREKAEQLYKERLAKNIPGTQETDWLTAEKILRGMK